MQNIIFLLFGLLISQLGVSQNIQVIDQNGKPIPNVFIFTDNHHELSDENGYVEILLFENDVVFFQHINFTTIQLTPVQIKSMIFKVQLDGKTNLMDEIELVGRTGQDKQEIFQQLESIKIKDLHINQSQSTPEFLENNSGVFMQKTQMGGGSPIVRGFEANRVLLVQDGVRMNNAIYRNGHLQNILSIDDQALEKIDLIYGPGSLNYGSDAIGGVIHFVSKNPKFSTKNLNYYSSYATANNGIKTYVDFNLGNEKLASITSFGYGNYGDLRTGKKRKDSFPDFGKRIEYVETINGQDVIKKNENPNLQVGTGYQQWNVSNKTKYLWNDHLSVTSNLSYSSSTDVPRYDFLSEYRGDKLKYAEWSYGPQFRLFASATIDYIKQHKLFDQSKTIISYQKINEERITRRVDDVFRNTNNENLDVYGVTIDFIKHINAKDKLSYGVDFQYNDLKSIVDQENISTGDITDKALTRYPNDENSMQYAGIYANYYFNEIFKHFHLNLGARVQQTNIKLKYKANEIVIWPEEYYQGIENNNTSVTGSIAAKYEPNKSISLNLMTASSFRSPNIDDMSKIRVKGDEISIVNIDLKPEQALNNEISLTLRPFKNKKNYFDIVLFKTFLKNAIIRIPFQYNGQDEFINNGDTLQIFANANASNADVHGISLKASIEIIEQLVLDVMYTKILGNQEYTANHKVTPFSHIPPGYGRISLNYKKKKWAAKFNYKYYGEKPLDEYGSSTDNLENATADGTPNYNLFDIETAYNLNEQFKISLGIKNILDSHYRLFSSGVSGSGRNFVVSVSGLI